MSEESPVTVEAIGRDDNQIRVVKIIVVGDSSVGKTCLTYRFCKRRFLDAADATIGVDFYEKLVEIDGCPIRLQLWDTAGQERFRKSMVQHYYRNVHAVIIVYDVTKIGTFNSVETWVEETVMHGLDGDTPRVLVGTQCDREDRRAVSTFAAQRLADAYGMPLFETSSYLDCEMETVDAIFMTLAHKIYNRRPFRVISTEESSDLMNISLTNAKRNKKIKCC